MRCYKLVVYGRVQGVGFRYYIYNFIHEHLLPVEGYVRNLPQGEVEVVIQGDPHDLKLIEDACYEGPRTGKVEHVEKMEIHYTEDFESFSIRY